jgi:hypothetical protein
VFKADPALYQHYHAAAHEERPPAWGARTRREPTDDDPAEAVLKAAQRLSPEDPLGRGLTLVQQRQPELWRTYRRDDA